MAKKKEKQSRDPIERLDESVNRFQSLVTEKGLQITAVLNPIADIFILSFREMFLRNMYQILGADGKTKRSNWTYHIAFCIKEAADLLDLRCQFEALGRLDGVIETIDDPPELVFIAEWEWDHQDIFGKGKELDKLWNGLKKEEGNGAALLFTYCPEKDYYAFVNEVISYWKKRARGKPFPMLYLLIVSYTGFTIRQLKYVRTAVYRNQSLEVWEDISLDGDA